MEPIFTPLHLKNITPTTSTTQPTFISPRKFTGRKKQPLDAVRKLDKKGFLRAFVTRGGVKVVKSEHQLQRMMSHWNEKLLSPTPHLSSQPTLTFRMSCVYRIVYKHPDEPFPFVWFCQKIIIKWISMLRSHHIIADLSTTAVLWEVMQKLQQSWIQHHPLHIH